MKSENYYGLNFVDTHRGLRYLYVDPTRHSVNYGDSIINYATLELMSKYLPKPSGIFDWKTGEYPAGDYDFMIVPGVTMLTDGSRPGFEKIPELPFPTYCLSGNLWSDLSSGNGILLRSRVLELRKKTKPSLGYVKMMSGPIGCRDPFTYDLLKSEGFEAVYTGCPTLTLPPTGVCDDGYVLFSLGRGRVRTQTRLARGLAKTKHVIGICHEIHDLKKYRSVGWDLPLVNFHDDIDLYLSYFKRASMVVSGRLHGTLPALVYGKPVFYYGTIDSRTSILNDLGIKINNYRDVKQVLKKADNSFNRHILNYYLQNWEYLFNSILKKHGGKN